MAVTSDTTLLGQMDDYILDGKFHEATDCYDMYSRHFVSCPCTWEVPGLRHSQQRRHPAIKSLTVFLRMRGVTTTKRKKWAISLYTQHIQEDRVYRELSARLCPFSAQLFCFLLATSTRESGGFQLAFQRLGGVVHQRRVPVSPPWMATPQAAQLLKRRAAWHDADVVDDCDEPIGEVENPVGDLYDEPGMGADYTRRFHGTSSASAIIAGVAASLQSVQKEHHGYAMTSHEMRALLMKNSTPQQGDQWIGPLPDMKQAEDRQNKRTFPGALFAFVPLGVHRVVGSELLLTQRVGALSWLHTSIGERSSKPNLLQSSD